MDQRREGKGYDEIGSCLGKGASRENGVSKETSETDAPMKYGVPDPEPEERQQSPAIGLLARDARTAFCGLSQNGLIFAGVGAIAGLLLAAVAASFWPPGRWKLIMQHHHGGAGSDWRGNWFYYGFLILAYQGGRPAVFP